MNFVKLLTFGALFAFVIACGDDSSSSSFANVDAFATKAFVIESEGSAEAGILSADVEGRFRRSVRAETVFELLRVDSERVPFDALVLVQRSPSLRVLLVFEVGKRNGAAGLVEVVLGNIGDLAVSVAAFLPPSAASRCARSFSAAIFLAEVCLELLAISVRRLSDSMRSTAALAISSLAVNTNWKAPVPCRGKRTPGWTLSRISVTTRARIP